MYHGNGRSTCSPPESDDGGRRPITSARPTSTRSSSNRAKAAAGSNAAWTAASARSARSWPGIHRRALCSPGSLTPEFKYDPDLITEVEVHFIPEGANATRVEFEHRNLERFGERADAMRQQIDAPEGWATSSSSSPSPQTKQKVEYHERHRRLRRARQPVRAQRPDGPRGKRRPLSAAGDRPARAERRSASQASSVRPRAGFRARRLPPVRNPGDPALSRRRVPRASVRTGRPARRCAHEPDHRHQRLVLLPEGRSHRRLPAHRRPDSPRNPDR